MLAINMKRCDDANDDNEDIGDDGDLGGEVDNGDNDDTEGDGDLGGEEGDDGGEVGDNAKDSEAGEENTLAPELKLLPNLIYLIVNIVNYHDCDILSLNIRIFSLLETGNPFLPKVKLLQNLIIIFTDHTLHICCCKLQMQRTIAYMSNYRHHFHWSYYKYNPKFQNKTLWHQK